jgi:hypothetical protein
MNGELIHRPHGSQIGDPRFISNGFTEMVIFETLFDGKRVGYSDLVKAVEGRLSPIALVTRQFDKYLDRTFDSDPDGYYLSNDQILVVNQLRRFRFLLSDFGKYSDDELKKLLETAFSIDKMNPGFIGAIVCENSRRRTGETALFYEVRYFEYLLKRNATIQRLDSAIDYVDPMNKHLDLSFIVSDPFVLGAMMKAQMRSIYDLSSILPAILADSIFLLLDDVLPVLEALRGEPVSALSDFVSKTFDQIPEKERVYFYELDGIGNRLEEKTLEEVGALHNVTRERARQIKVKVEGRLQENLLKARILTNLVMTEKVADPFDYLSIEDACSLLGNQLITDQVITLARIDEQSTVGFDNELKYLYTMKGFPKENAVSKKEFLEAKKAFEDHILEDVPAIMTPSAFGAYSGLVKRVIDKRYYQRTNGLFVKKGTELSALLTQVVDENFYPNGYHKSKKSSDYETLCAKAKEKYGDDYPVPTRHAVEATLEREGYCEIARGTYLNKKYCVTIPEDLMDQMIDYAWEVGGAVQYKQIYSKFSNELKELGVKDSCYLKGLIDPVLDPELFHHKSHYIQVGGSKLTSREAMGAFLHGQKGIFTLQEIRSAFMGVKDYTIFDSLFRNPDIIWLSGTSFIKAADLAIDEGAKAEILKEINAAFELSKEETVSSRKVFARIRILKPELSKRLDLIQDSFAFFSFVKFIFADKFYFRRPYLSKDPNASLDASSLVLNYLKKQGTFSKATVDEYCLKANIHDQQTYLGFMEDISDEFVQFDKSSMVRKDLLAVDEITLEDLKETIAMIVKANGSLDTSTFKAYQLFPAINGYRWNKYLLAGLVRTYLSNHYEVENTDNMYNLTDFIIKEERRDE